MRNLGEISVIVPFYNAQKYIPRCITSLLKQTYPYFKVYFIDDASTDRSSQILREYNDLRSTIMRQEKKGVSAARNLGLKNSSEEYIAFMDIDDELRPDYLEKLITSADKYQVDVVLCNYYAQYADGRKVEVLLPWENVIIGHNEIHSQLLPLMIYGDQQNATIGGNVWRLLIRRPFWEKCDIWFHVDMSIAEDLSFALALYNRAESIYVLSDCLYAYHQNLDSVMHQNLEYSSIRGRHRDTHKALKDILEKEGLMQGNQDRYWTRWLSYYTRTISILVRQTKSPWKTCSELKELRRELLCESVSFCQCTYLSKGRKLSLWMLKHRMYIPLLALYWIKEKYKLRHY